MIKFYMNDREFIKKAIENAKESVSNGGFPAGAVVVKNKKIVGEGISIGKKINDPTSHAEINAIRDACKNLKTSNLSGLILYSSMEPCLMCFGASMYSSISKIIFALPREMTSKEYYGGDYNNNLINLKFINPIEMIHFSELENESFKIVSYWEKNLNNNI